ncbi:MAG: hypothetical protein IT378_04025, partial [Sandaracinaceae bacterium]|nr:hypothetical protein [Sandaracinaceae bacterium]
EAGNRHDGLEDVDLVCTACHMAPTAQGGMPLRGLLDEHPTGSTAVQYYVGDLGSHRQRVSRASEVGAQPTSYTQACGLCHAVSLPNP